MLGFEVSERTISRWMKHAPRDPEPAKRWLAFLHNHREAIAAMDFFTVPTISFTTRDLYPQTLQALQMAPEPHKLASLRYGLWKLRAKGLVEKIAHSRRYRLLAHGYQICLVFLKLYEKIYAPLTAAILQPFAADQSIPREKITALDQRYTAVIRALDDLVDVVGLKAA
jgi:hypothetical protein